MPEETIGHVNFDGERGENNEVEFRVPNPKLKTVSRGLYVEMKIPKDSGKKSYLGRVVSGPFFQTDAVGKDSAFARASILEADKVQFRPDYHGVCRAEILGEIIDREKWILAGASQRPYPQTPVNRLSEEAISKLIGTEGDVHLGSIAGYPGVKVYFNSERKDVLPRNLGIFGTVGSGKTNTTQVLIEQLASFGWSIIVLDVEGEYVRMDEPSEEAVRNPLIKRKMEQYGIKPKGISNIRVLHPKHTETNREDLAEEFGIRFANIDPHVFVELLDFNNAQAERFMSVYNTVDTREQERRKKDGKRPSDMIDAITNEEKEDLVGITLNDIISEVRNRLSNTTNQADRSSFPVVLRRLNKLKRTGIFDTKEHLGDYSELLKKGSVSVFDMSDSVNTIINNIVISTLLDEIFELKNADKKNQNLPPVMIVMEEAHSYISRERAKNMSETMDVLRKIARRGRKRWLSLCFVSQQPAHLPHEIYELCNTKVVHQTTGKQNLNAVKDSAGAVNDSLWQDVPVMGQGRALIISPQFRHSLMVDVRPCASNRGMTE